MAELGAGVAIAASVLKLGQFLHEHASFLFGIRDKIETLKNDLRWMQKFLQDAEKKLDNDSLIREWVSDVRDLAYDCEDIIDTFLLKLTCMGDQTQPNLLVKFRNTYKLSRQIEKLMKKANDISSRRERYGLDATDVSTTSNSREKKLMQLRRSAPYANNEHMVGLGETVSLLERKLTNGGSGRFVISILGMGGLDMAEALGAGVAIAASVLKLGQFLHEHASFLFGIRDKIETLKKELIWMQSFLQDAEKKLDNDDSSIRVWGV